MSVDVLEIFASGQSMAEADSEVSWRNSASRVYYAGYHRALASVHVCPDNSNQRMGDHERLTDRFKLHNTKASGSIAYVLIAMKRIRHMADYEIGDGFEQSLALNQVTQYKALSDKLISFDDANVKKADVG